MLSVLKNILTYKPYEVPKENVIPILLIPVIVFMLYILEIIPCFYYDLDLYIFVILYSIIVTFKYVEPYLTKVKGKYSNIIYATLLILIISGFFIAFGFVLIGSQDPQNLNSQSISLPEFLYIHIVKFVFVGVTEELFCFYILLIFLTLIKNKYKLFISIILTSLIFGLLHGINWPLISTIPISLGHIPFIYSYIKFKSLLPAIAAHILEDTLATLILVPGFSSYPVIFLQLIGFIVIMFSYNKFNKIICE